MCKFSCLENYSLIPQFTVGSIYTSLTGFTKEDSAGSVQLAALGRLLFERGFHMWDLGMDMDYKRGIGSHLMPRETFVNEVHRVRETQGHLVLPAGAPPQNCKDVIDRNSNQPNPTSHAQKNNSNHTSSQGKSASKTPKTGAAESQNSIKDQAHTPPLAETESPIKKRVRKSDSQDEDDWTS